MKIYPSMAAHPIERLRSAGVRVSVNTDDPSLLATDLPSEYELARSTFGWTDAIIRDVARTSIEASFADDDMKSRLKSRLSLWSSH
jgi:adenosine deaminase